MPTLAPSRLLPRRFPQIFLRNGSAAPEQPRKAWIVPAVVLLAALLLAGCLYERFLGVHRFLWVNPTHDRNAHYLYALRLASDVGNGQLVQLVIDLNESRVWPPLHGMMAAAVLLAGGLDYRLAVLPSLAGWVITVLFGFLVARRAVTRGGTLAGLVAAVFIASSPAHRAFATDIMLESLGAGFTLVVLYAYLVTVQGHEEESWKGRCLGIALSVLFLEKYNYWLLVVLALGAAEFAVRPRYLVRLAGDALSRIDWKRAAASQLRYPLSWGIASLLLLITVVAFRGDRPFAWGGQRISLYPPHNLIHITYVLIFLRLASWWRRTGRFALRMVDSRVRQVILWHVCPMSIWFLLPKHPSYFLWYLSLANADPQQHVDLLRGLHQYGTWLIEDYHFGLSSVLLALGLLITAILAWRQLRTGGHAVFLLLLIAAVLAVIHPNQKSRNLHSWLATLWIGAGMGAAMLVYRDRWRRWSPALAGGVLLGLGWLHHPALMGEGHAPEGGPHPALPSLLEATDAYLVHLDSAHRAVVLTAVPLKPMTQWTYLERHGSLARLEEHWYGFGTSGEENRRCFQQWLRSTDCDTLIYCAQIAGREWPDAGPECRLHGEVEAVLRSQQTFRLVKQHEIPHYACRVEVWQR
jgi:hypothetical protein